MHWGSFTILHFRVPSALGGAALELGYTLVMLCVCVAKLAGCLTALMSRRLVAAEPAV